jgi:hypothetical protein
MNRNILKEIFFDENKNWDRFVNIHRKSIRKIVTGLRVFQVLVFLFN